MRYGEDFPRDIRMRPRRRGPRMNSRVPVAIEWSGHAGPAVYSEPGFHSSRQRKRLLTCEPEGTLNCSSVCGSRICPRGGQLKAVVVWKGVQRPDGWDMGIEIVTHNQDFWGVEL